MHCKIKYDLSKVHAMMDKIFKAGFLLLFILGTVGLAFAGNDGHPPWKDPQSLLDYADGLMQRSEFDQAATEYKRFLHLYSGHPDAEEAEVRLGLAYRSAGDWKRAVEVFYGLAALYEEKNRLSARATLHLAETYSRAGMHAEALREYSGFIKRYPDDPLVPKARYGAGWAMMALGDGKGAANQFSLVDRSSSLYSNALDLSVSSLQLVDIRRPSPVLAGVLSAILPGAGQAYAGRPRNALISFLINGAFIAGAVASFARGNEGAGILISFLESGWYMGGISSAAQDAREVYREALDERLSGLARKHDFPLRLKPEEGRISIQFLRIPLDRILKRGGAASW
ncbi:MAG: tetratricopeptide repeat protein [Deltaproteobacteria bacterium]|nr:tetratricopeptide repeat protein [Deltaproteobacteria bacterium]